MSTESCCRVEICDDQHAVHAHGLCRRGKNLPTQYLSFQPTPSPAMPIPLAHLSDLEGFDKTNPPVVTCHVSFMSKFHQLSRKMPFDVSCLCRSARWAARKLLDDLHQTLPEASSIPFVTLVDNPAYLNVLSSFGAINR